MPEKPEEIEQSQSTEAPKSGKKRRMLMLGGLASAIAIVVGTIYYVRTLSYESTDDAFVEAHVVAVSPRVMGHVAKVLVEDNQWVEAGDPLVELDPHDFQAEVDSAQAALKAARAAGKSGHIKVDLTSVTTSAELDQAKASVQAAEAAVQAAQAQIDAAQSQKEQAVAQLASAKAVLAQATAEVQAAQAQFERDSIDCDRYSELLQSNAITEQQLDHSKAAKRGSAAALEAARQRVEAQKSIVAQAEAAIAGADQNLKRAKAQLELQKAQKTQAAAQVAKAETYNQQVAFSQSEADRADASVEQAEAKLEQAKLRLSYTCICAPCSGHVTKKMVEPGAFVQVGQSLLAIVQPDAWVVANYKETQLTDVRPGQPVKVAIDMYPGVEFDGHVDSIQRGSGARFSLLPPENATGNFIKVVQRVPVKIVFDDPGQLRDYLMVPGASVVPVIDISKKPAAQ